MRGNIAPVRQERATCRNPWKTNSLVDTARILKRLVCLAGPGCYSVRLSDYSVGLSFKGLESEIPLF